MNRILSLVCVLGLALTVAGCPSKKPTLAPNATSETVAPSSGTTAGAGASDTGQAKALPGQGSTTSAEAALLAKTTIYFDFDSSEIKPEYAPIVAAHGKRLAADRSLKVRLEGNTDERGSAEYNVALGERRAQSVKRALLLQGATEGQLTTVSYGEERPVAEGHDEAAWAQNRRVEIAYSNAR
jgi:peptidoglycan-associated lipoprotein